MKIPFGNKVSEYNWSIPKLITGNVPDFDTLATSLMKETFKNKGIATIEELRELCIDWWCEVDRLPNEDGRVRIFQEDFIDGVIFEELLCFSNMRRRRYSAVYVVCVYIKIFR